MCTAYENKMGQININHCSWRLRLAPAEAFDGRRNWIVFMQRMSPIVDNVYRQWEMWRKNGRFNFVFNAYMKSFSVFNNRVSWTAPYHVNLPLIRAAMHLNISLHLNVKAPRDGSIFFMWRERIGKCSVRFAQVERIPIQWHVCRDNVRIVLYIQWLLGVQPVFDSIASFEHLSITNSQPFQFSFYIQPKKEKEKSQQTNEIHRRNIQCENEKYPKYIVQSGAMYSVRERNAIENGKLFVAWIRERAEVAISRVLATNNTRCAIRKVRFEFVV